jgi:hypothetical protein
MTMNFTEPVDQSAIVNEPTPSATWQTIVGLFEDNIDTRNALGRLRKADIRSEAVSLLVRDRKADESGPAERHGAVARAVAANGFDQASGWLTKLASLVVAERGTYLVAGPVGAALAGMHVESDSETSAGSTITGIMVQLGFSQDEAGYIDSRLVSGALMIAITSDDIEQQERTRQAFAAESAVHIGRAYTDARVAETANALLVSPPETSSDGDVVVMDAVARFFRLCEKGRADGRRLALCGQTVVDPDGAESATVTEYIAETITDDGGAERDEVRYVVVSYGGMLGIGKRQTVIPVDQIDLDASPIRVNVTKDVLHRAPVYDHVAPFSRREEHTVCAYFGTTPYWSQS